MLTDQLVWDTIKGVLQQIHDKPPQSSSSIQSDHHDLNESDLIPSAEINLETKSLSDDRMTPLEFSQSQQSNMILSGQSLIQARNLHSFNGIASIAEYLSPEQIDLLSDQERKSVVNTLLSKVSVFFDRETKKHRIDVEFSEEISQLLNQERDTHSISLDTGKVSGEFCEDVELSLRGDTEKKSWGSAGIFTAEQDYMVTVE